MRLPEGVDVMVPDWLFEGDGLDPLVVGDRCDREIEIGPDEWCATNERLPSIKPIGVNKFGWPRSRVVGQARPGPAGEWVDYGFFVTDGSVWIWVPCVRGAPLPLADEWVQVSGCAELMYEQKISETFEPAREQAGLGPHPGDGAWIVEELIAVTPEYRLVRFARPVH